MMNTNCNSIWSGEQMNTKCNSISSGEQIDTKCSSISSGEQMLRHFNKGPKHTIVKMYYEDNAISENNIIISIHK